MKEQITVPRLVDRKDLCRILGNVSLSHVIRLDKSGLLGDARVQIGMRLVRYDLNIVKKLIDERSLCA